MSSRYLSAKASAVRHAVWAALLALLTAGMLFGGACLQDGQLGAAGPGAAKAAADNAYCYVCHVNYKTEKLARRHVREGVSCQKCHGRSDAHSADEDGATAPQVMYPKAKINPACMACHAEEKVAAKRAHKAALAKIRSAETVCTDCHGSHRLTVRTRRWDKATGKPIAGKPAEPK